MKNNNLFTDDIMNDIFNGWNIRKPISLGLYNRQVKNSSYQIVNEDDGSSTVYISAVGLSKKNLDIDVSDGKLKVTSDKSSDVAFISPLDYTFALSDVCDVDTIKANLEHGLLTINIGIVQPPPDKTKKIKIE